MGGFITNVVGMTNDLQTTIKKVNNLLASAGGSGDIGSIYNNMYGGIWGNLLNSIGSMGVGMIIPGLALLASTVFLTWINRRYRHQKKLFNAI